MEISNISSLLGVEQDLAESKTQVSGEAFKQALTNALENQDDKALKASCDEMEAYMLSMMFKQMKKCMLDEDEENALIPKGDYTTTFESTMIDAMAEQMVEAGGIGLSKQMYEQIKNTYGDQMAMSQQTNEKEVR